MTIFVAGGAPRGASTVRHPMTQRASDHRLPARIVGARRRRDARLDARALYHQMLRIRRFEEATARLWSEGRIAGEMHLGIGEEAIVAGVMAHVRDGDGLALDHRSTPPLVARGTDLAALLLEMLGSPEGLCGGRGGHMHLFDRERIAASSGIVGSSAPIACGFALAGARRRPGSVAVAFFGDGAANQGMLLEALNLAVAWRLPVLFVCKDNGWAITTRTRSVTGGDLLARARAFGLAGASVDGIDVRAVWKAAGALIGRARAGRGPGFLLARCRRGTGHFLGDPVLRIVDAPRTEGGAAAAPLVDGLRAGPGGPARERLAAALAVGRVIGRAFLERRLTRPDPLPRARRLVPADAARALEALASSEVAEAERAALAALRRAA